jgi:hypothetical protein
MALEAAIRNVDTPKPYLDRDLLVL